MSEWKELIKDSQEKWEQNADHWDDYMGEESNRFHRELIRPYNGNVVTTNSIQISKYLTSELYKAIGIKGQSIPHLMFHRPLSYYVNLFFESNYVFYGFETKVKGNKGFVFFYRAWV